MRTARRCAATAIAALCVGGCPDTVERAGDAGPATDADLDDAAFVEPDAFLPVCPGVATLQLAETRLTSDRSLEPGAALQDVLLDDDGSLWVLAYFRWHTDDGTGGIRQLARINPGGELLEVHEISRVSFSWNGTASMARVGSEMWSVLLEGAAGDRRVELVRVAPGGSLTRVWLAPEEGASVGGVALRQTAEALPELLLTGDDTLVSYRLAADGSLTARTVGVALDSESRLALGVDRESRDCLVARDRSAAGGGSSYLFDLREGLRTTSPEPSPRTSFLSMPVRAATGCAEARFVEDVTQPHRGGVSATNEALVVEGWFGTVPMGMSLVGPHEGGPMGVVLATRDGERAETTNVYWVELVGSGACRVDRPLATYGGVLGRGVPLGTIVAVRDGERVRVVTSDLTAPGEIAWGSILPAL